MWVSCVDQLRKLLCSEGIGVRKSTNLSFQDFTFGCEFICETRAIVVVRSETGLTCVASIELAMNTPRKSKIAYQHASEEDIHFALDR